MIFFREALPTGNTHRAAITAAYRMDETKCVEELINHLHFSTEMQSKISATARELVEKVREHVAQASGVEALMMHYDLSSEEGIMLMCLAEALLRIPDKETEDLLIRDKLTSAKWEKHIGASESSFVNMATWGLALTGKVLKPTEKGGYFTKIWRELVRRSGEPIIRQAVREAIKVMSEQFVLGRTIEEAIKKSHAKSEKGYSFSFDMLGEVARTQADADRYFASYQHAIDALGKSVTSKNNLFHGPSISIKLSALYPRYEFNKRELAIPALSKSLKTLALQAEQAGITVTVDAEESDRLDMMLDIFENVFSDSEFKEWHGLGLAVQAYQKRAFSVIRWLTDLSRKHNKRIPVRLVKGAYWDTEIKLSQIFGFDGYPVFTRKASTDISYLACARQMLAAQDAIYPQFATHNAYSVAAILTMLGDDIKKYDFEFQNLQGMGKALHDQLVKKVACRVYAPVGSHEDLLPYLVRRLLENGANSSFVNKIADKNTPIEILIADPVQQIRSFSQIPNSKIPLPRDIYGKDRINSSGIDFSNYRQLSSLSQEVEAVLKKEWSATPFNLPLQSEIAKGKNAKVITNPNDRREIIGKIVEANKEDIDLALNKAGRAFEKWDKEGFEKRANLILEFSNLLEKHRSELMALAAKEAGKTLQNALNEVREATDFCRYYAAQAKNLMPESLRGPTGESNTLLLGGRGTMVSISPWNFPIAIFTGQMVAALVTGNCVIVKPAEQTPLVAARIVELAYEAKIPRDVLQLLPGTGEVVGAELVADPRVNGVLFTGSTETAKAIQRTLSHRSGPIPLLIAETGGINFMIADSSALPEQLIADVISSAFDSAGQRCSALRVLCVQEEIADNVIKMLQGAMAEMIVSNPLQLQTDIGPVIDHDAKQMLEAHQEKMQKEAKLVYRVNLPAETQHGTFVAPQAYVLPDISLVTREVFGPILHIIRYRYEDLDKLIDSINALGYGLTFGIQSRIDETIDYIQSRIKAGNIYVNRNIIGAVVGVQPFGGSRLSGTGPKAGGPQYLLRLCNEYTVTVNTSAVGGNASLMAMSE